jgi:hypothetical protein
MSSNFSCSYMARRSLTYISGFFWFVLIWLSGFRGEDLNVIFYQNMPNLHNRYKSAERNISQKNPEIYVKLLLAYANWAYFDKRSHLNLLFWNRWTKLNQPWVGLFQNCVRQPWSFIKICLICIIGIYRLKEIFHRKTWNIC